MPKLGPISGRDLVKILLKTGFEISPRKSNDHICLRKRGCLRPLVIPDWKSLPEFVIRNNINSAGITKEQYFKLRSQI